VRAVPFGTLSITGDPRGVLDPSGVDRRLPTLHRKIVRRERGGYCFELNGLFCRLLTELGYDARRVPARALSDGTRASRRTPAIVVALDRAYLVDVGLGTPKVTRPVTLDGTVATARIDWRVAPADRPDEDYRVAAREPGDARRARYASRSTGRARRRGRARRNTTPRWRVPPGVAVAADERLRPVAAVVVAERGRTDPVPGPSRSVSSYRSTRVVLRDAPGSRGAAVPGSATRRLTPDRA